MKIKFSPESGGFGECAVVQKYRQRQNTHTHRVGEGERVYKIPNHKKHEA